MGTPFQGPGGVGNGEGRGDFFKGKFVGWDWALEGEEAVKVGQVTDCCNGSVHEGGGDAIHKRV